MVFFDLRSLLKFQIKKEVNNIGEIFSSEESESNASGSSFSEKSAPGDLISNDTVKSAKVNMVSEAVGEANPKSFFNAHSGGKCNTFVRHQ